jgi:phosphate/sulfate permease
MRQRQRGSEILFHQDDNIVTAWVITLPASALIAALYLLPGLFRWAGNRRIISKAD